MLLPLFSECFIVVFYSNGNKDPLVAILIETNVSGGIVKTAVGAGGLITFI